MTIVAYQICVPMSYVATLFRLCLREFGLDPKIPRYCGMFEVTPPGYVVLLDSEPLHLCAFVPHWIVEKESESLFSIKNSRVPLLAVAHHLAESI